MGGRTGAWIPATGGPVLGVSVPLLALTPLCPLWEFIDLDKEIRGLKSQFMNVSRLLVLFSVSCLSESPLKLCAPVSPSLKWAAQYLISVL